MKSNPSSQKIEVDRMKCFPMYFSKKCNTNMVADVFGLQADQVTDVEGMEDFALGDSLLRKSYSGVYKEVNDIIIPRADEFMTLFNVDTFRALRIEIRDIFMMGVIGEKWKKFKQVYKVDPDFIPELYNTDNVKIPVSALKNIPYKCFYVDLSNTNVFSPFFGFFVNISCDDKSDLPNITFLRVSKQEGMSEELFCSAYFTPKDFLEYKMISIENGEMFINVDRSQIDTNSKREVSNVAKLQGATAFQENTQKFVLFAFQLLLFLVSDKPDIVRRNEYAKKEKTGHSTAEAKHSAAEAKHSAAEAKQVKFSDIGFRYGETIRAYKREYASSTTQTREMSTHTGDKVGNRKKPVVHIRRAHWHLYWTGPGRKVPIVKWLSPCIAGSREDTVTINKIER